MIYISDFFSSVSEKVEIEIRGFNTTDRPLQWIINAYDECDNETVVYRNDLVTEQGTFTVLYYFDAVSLAVYHGAVRFRLAIEGIDNAEEIKELVITLCEQNTIEQEEGNDIEEHYVVGKTLRKVLFVGNSLLLGMFNTYGMCASASDKDYAYYVEKEIRKHYPDCEFYKLHGSAFEHSINDEMYDEWYSNGANAYTGRPACESFTNDLDMILLQLTDNVNTPEKVTFFERNVERFLKDIKKNSPNADIIWVHGWYNKSNTITKVKEICQQYGIVRIDISDLHTKENESYSGQCSIKADGTKVIVKDTWITHPGDAGMKEIAERILNRIQL